MTGASSLRITSWRGTNDEWGRRPGAEARSIADAEAGEATSWASEFTTDAVLLHDVDGRILAANQRAAELLGYSVAELRGLDMFALEASLASESRAATRQIWERAEVGAVATARGRFIRSDGAELPVELRVAVRDGDDGRQVLLVARDIRDRLRVERALRDSEERLRFVFEGSPIGMLRSDARGVMSQVNAALGRFFAADRRSLTGRALPELVVAEDTAAATALLAALAADPATPVGAELRFVAGDGPRWGRLTLFAEPDSSGGQRQTLGMLEDIDARRRAESRVQELLRDLEAQVERRTAELRRTNERLRVEVAERERAEAAQSRFMLVMSHELRTPLSVILGYTELYLDELRDGSPARPDALIRDLERVRGEGLGLLALIEAILRFSQGATGDDAAPRKTALAPLLRELGALAARRFARPDLAIRVELAPGLGEVETQPERLRRALWQLLENAHKFTPRGELALVGRRRVDAAGEHVELAVRDSGVGIAPEALSRLFEPFRQLDDAPTRRFGGVGIGLALCRRDCEALGGDITVESRPGEGSCFTIRLPAARAPTPGHGRDDSPD